MNEACFYNALQILYESDYRRLGALKRTFGTWREAWENLSPQERKSLDPRKEWRKLEESGARIILFEDKGYPSLLREIPYPPFGVYIKGNLPREGMRRLAIVGTRKATTSGKETARKFAGELSRAGFNIVSGLAFGIDVAAHLGALEEGGSTLAVLGNGLDRIYPRSHEHVAKRILVSRGALISEYPLDSPSLPYRFLERNRIVSGLSEGVLVIEAPRESGALTTARFALEQNREVFVVPGPVDHYNFKGSHRLIRHGAELVTSAEDVCEAFGLARQTPLEFPASPEEKTVIELLKKHREPLPIDKIIELTNLKANIVSQTLSFLLIKNLVQENDKGYFLS